MANEIHATTSFMIIYDSFLSKVTSDMYMELTELETIEMLQDLLLNGLQRFEFPKFDLNDYTIGHWEDLGNYRGIESDNIEVPATGWVGGAFNCLLTDEEINILSSCMVIEWLGQQLHTTENTRMKYSGSDFKFTSQANHMAKIKVLLDNQKIDCNHLQKLYSRRVFKDGRVQSTMGKIVSKSGYGVDGNNINQVGFWVGYGNH